MQQSGLEVFLIVAYKPLDSTNNRNTFGQRENTTLHSFKSKTAAFEWVSSSPDTSPLIDAREYKTKEGESEVTRLVPTCNLTTLSSHPDPKSGHILSVTSQGNCMKFTVTKDGILTNPETLIKPTHPNRHIAAHCLWNEYLICFPTSGNPKISKNGALLLSLDQILQQDDQTAVTESEQTQQSPTDQETIFWPKPDYFGHSLSTYGQIAKVRSDLLFFLTKADDLVFIDLSQLKNVTDERFTPQNCRSLKYSSLREFEKDPQFTELCDMEVCQKRFLFVLTEHGTMRCYKLRHKSKKVI